MRRAALAIMTGAMLFALTGCGGGGAASMDALRENLAAAEEISVSAVVSATTDGRYTEYTLEYVSNSDGCTVSVTEPDELAGVTASFDEAAGTLKYDGLVLSFEVPGSVTPVTALPTLIAALTDAYETISWTEGENTFVSLAATDSLTVTLELDARGTPVWAEFLENGESVSTCEITQFSLTEA